MNTSSNQFGILVSTLLPGFVALAGIAPFVPVVARWMQPLNESEANLGAPLYAVLAAATLGMVVSCFRWLLIDHVHHWTGVRPPVWDDRQLGERVVAFHYLVNAHLMWAHFYGGTLIALAFAYAVNRIIGTSQLLGPVTDFVMLVLCVTLFAGSRDALSKYYSRTTQLLGSRKGSANDQRQSQR